MRHATAQYRRALHCYDAAYADTVRSQKPGSGSAKAHHLYVEAFRLSHADRTRYIGDPLFYKVPSLLDAAHLRNRSENINPRVKSRVRTATRRTARNSPLGGDDSSRSRHRPHICLSWTTAGMLFPLQPHSGSASAPA